jgi:hypothetical protein
MSLFYSRKFVSLFFSLNCVSVCNRNNVRPVLAEEQVCLLFVISKKHAKPPGILTPSFNSFVSSPFSFACFGTTTVFSRFRECDCNCLFVAFHQWTMFRSAVKLAVFRLMHHASNLCAFTRRASSFHHFCSSCVSNKSFPALAEQQQR